MPRTLKKGWCDVYLDIIRQYTESPESWGWWASITAVGASLRKHVYIDRGSYRLYPNDYVVLVGRPGLGKGSAINPIISILDRANTVNILSDRLTIEWILETMSKGFPAPSVGPGGGQTFGFDTTALLVAPELSVFLRFPEDQLPDLTDLWDARDRKCMYGTRGKGLVTVDKPGPSMLAGCAPEWLTHCIPANAVGGGFTRRVNFIYEKDESQSLPWPSHVDINTLTEPLVEDLRAISQLHGEYKFDNLARPIFEQMYVSRNAVAWEDEATANYVISRWAHVAKISMALAASRRDDLVITKSDIEEAADRIVDVTNALSIVFRSVGQSDMVTVADKVMRFLETKGAATFKQILGVMYKDCLKAELEVILLTLTDAGVVQEQKLGQNTVFKVIQKTAPKARRRGAP
jgi:hypothetical protein